MFSPFIYIFIFSDHLLYYFNSQYLLGEFFLMHYLNFFKVGGVGGGGEEVSCLC